MQNEEIMQDIVLGVLYLNGGEMDRQKLEDEVCSRIDNCDGFLLQALSEVKRELRERKKKLN